MGNNASEGVPVLLAKNWAAVPGHPNSFRNRLTLEYSHKHIINVDNSMEIQSFRNRMKQSNPYICRVLFYHQFHESIYHVYTDQMHLQPATKPAEKWELHKLRIMESFQQLAKIYAPMRVCRQMIGCDSNGNCKIWIHADPVASRPWSECNSQALMISDIFSIFRTYEQKAAELSTTKSLMKRTAKASLTQEYSTFSDAIQALGHCLRNGNPAKNSSFVAHNMSNFNININIELDAKQKSSNKLQKLFNPIVCQTTRNEDREYARTGSPDPRTSKLIATIPERPYTYFEGGKEWDLKQKDYSPQFRLARRDSGIATSAQQFQFLNPMSKIMGEKERTKIKRSDTYKAANVSKNLLARLLSKAPIKASVVQTIRQDNEDNRLDKGNFERQQEPKISNLSANYIPTKKNKTIPNFLLQKPYCKFEKQQKFNNTISIQKYPVTERNRVYGKDFRQNTLFDFYKNKYEEESNEAQTQEDNSIRNRKNTAQKLKDELNDILEMPIEKQNMVSFSFENFKINKHIYRHHSDIEGDDRDENELIKQKVQKKKATFAHLKMQAMKILEDDI